MPTIEKAIKAPEIIAKIENRGYIVDYKSPAELTKVMISTYEIARSLAAKLGLSK